MNIHIRTGPKYEYSYNLTNSHENWAQKKCIPVHRYSVRIATGYTSLSQIPQITKNTGILPNVSHIQENWLHITSSTNIELVIKWSMVFKFSLVNIASEHAHSFSNSLHTEVAFWYVVDTNNSQLILVIPQAQAQSNLLDCHLTPV